MFQQVSTSLCSAVFTYLPVTLPIISSYIFSCFITFLYIVPTNCAFERDFEDAARRLRHRRLRGAACGMTWTSTPSPVARAKNSSLGQKCQMQIPETWRPMETDGDLWNMCFRTPHLLWHQQRQPLCCYKGRSFLVAAAKKPEPKCLVQIFIKLNQLNFNAPSLNVSCRRIGNLHAPWAWKITKLGWTWIDLEMDGYLFQCIWTRRVALSSCGSQMSPEVSDTFNQ